MCVLARRLSPKLQPFLTPYPTSIFHSSDQRFTQAVTRLLIQEAGAPMRGLVDKLTAAVAVTGIDLVRQQLLQVRQQAHLHAQLEADAATAAAAVAAAEEDSEVADILSGALAPGQLVLALRGQRTLAPPLPLGSPSATHETHRRYALSRPLYIPI